jgi:hypothetical protein
MSRALVYVDTSEVRDGALEDLKAAIRELADFVDENEPQLISHDVHFSEEGTRVIHVHTDPASLCGGAALRRFAGLLTPRSIHIYGEPSERRSASCAARYLLGSGEVAVHAPRAGFGRFASSERPAPSAG